MNFKEFIEANAATEDEIFGQKDITRKTDISRLLGFNKPLQIYNKQGSFATLYIHPTNNALLIKVTSHDSDIVNLIKAQKIQSHNIPKLEKWPDGQLLKSLPKLKSKALIVEKIIGKSMVYPTNAFIKLTLNGNFELAKDWLDSGGHKAQLSILDYFKKNTPEELSKLSDLFAAMLQLERVGIELVDFSDNILDAGNRYVIIDMGF